MSSRLIHILSNFPVGLPDSGKIIAEVDDPPLPANSGKVAYGGPNQTFAGTYSPTPDKYNLNLYNQIGYVPNPGQYNPLEMTDSKNGDGCILRVFLQTSSGVKYPGTLGFGDDDDQQISTESDGIPFTMFNP